MKQQLCLNMHVSDLDRARLCAESLGLQVEAYILLASHLVTTAALSGSSTVAIPEGLLTTANHSANGPSACEKI